MLFNSWKRKSHKHPRSTNNRLRNLKFLVHVWLHFRRIYREERGNRSHKESSLKTKFGLSNLKILVEMGKLVCSLYDDKIRHIGKLIKLIIEKNEE